MAAVGVVVSGIQGEGFGGGVAVMGVCAWVVCVGRGPGAGVQAARPHCGLHLVDPGGGRGAGRRRETAVERVKARECLGQWARERNQGRIGTRFKATVGAKTS